MVKSKPIRIKTNIVSQVHLKVNLYTGGQYSESESIEWLLQTAILYLFPK